MKKFLLSAGIFSALFLFTGAALQAQESSNAVQPVVITFKADPDSESDETLTLYIQKNRGGFLPALLQSGFAPTFNIPIGTYRVHATISDTGGNSETVTARLRARRPGLILDRFQSPDSGNNPGDLEGLKVVAQKSGNKVKFKATYKNEREDTVNGSFEIQDENGEVIAPVAERGQMPIYQLPVGRYQIDAVVKDPEDGSTYRDTVVFDAEAGGYSAYSDSSVELDEENDEGEFDDEDDTPPISTRPSITVLSPNGGENYVLERSVISVRYQSSNLIGSRLVANLSDPNGRDVYMASASARDTGVIEVPLTTTYPDYPGQYKITLCAEVNRDAVSENICDASNAPFTITAPDVSGLCPSGQTWNGSICVPNSTNIEGICPSGQIWKGAVCGKPLVCGALGDVNNDGVISETDKELIRTFVLTTAVPTDAQKKNSDTSGDGAVTTADISLISAYLAGTRTTFPGCSSASPSITVLSPNGGESYKIGDAVNVSWNVSNLPANTNVGLQLSYNLNGATFEDGLTSSNLSPDSRGGYSWVILAKYAGSGMNPNLFKMRAILYGPNIPGTNPPQDYSDSYFTITAPTSQAINCSSATIGSYPVPAGQHGTSVIVGIQNSVSHGTRFATTTFACSSGTFTAGPEVADIRCEAGYSSVGTNCVAADTVAEFVSLASVIIEGSNVKVTYSKNFDTCAHLKDEGGSMVHASNYFCSLGTNVVVTQAMSNFSVAPGARVRLCHGNNANLCSEFVTVTGGTTSRLDALHAFIGSVQSAGVYNSVLLQTYR
ncbi:MAG: dockerin type I repeat-containing protein [bacterium]|nr:dockerin type I repeat-containing protein [bacterium]